MRLWMVLVIMRHKFFHDGLLAKWREMWIMCLLTYLPYSAKQSRRGSLLGGGGRPGSSACLGRATYTRVLCFDKLIEVIIWKHVEHFWSGQCFRLPAHFLLQGFCIHRGTHGDCIVQVRRQQLRKLWLVQDRWCCRFGCEISCVVSMGSGTMGLSRRMICFIICAKCRET